MRKKIIPLALAVTMCLFLMPFTAANASVRRQEPARIVAMLWALKQRGKWYCWGGTGPSCFDCSGLVVQAYQHAGISLPRTTAEMLDSRMLRRVSTPEKGDLAFYSPSHVELYAHGDLTFGAHETGQRIGWIQEWEQPTFYQVE
jgi:cell wall-associated NlpC family hydrolase